MNRDAQGFPMYHSESKGIDIPIREMHTGHAINAWRKEQAKGDMEIGRALAEELRARGGVLDTETMRWTMPAREEAAS